MLQLPKATRGTIQRTLVSLCGEGRPRPFQLLRPQDLTLYRNAQSLTSGPKLLPWLADKASQHRILIIIPLRKLSPGRRTLSGSPLRLKEPYSSTQASGPLADLFTAISHGTHPTRPTRHLARHPGPRINLCHIHRLHPQMRHSRARSSGFLQGKHRV